MTSNFSMFAPFYHPACVVEEGTYSSRAHVDRCRRNRRPPEVVCERRGAAGRVAAHRARRDLRAPGAERRGQDDLDLDRLRAGAPDGRAGADLGARRRPRFAARAPSGGPGAAGGELRSVLHAARSAALSDGVLRRAARRRTHRRGAAGAGSVRQGRHQHARAVRRHEAAAADREGAGPAPARRVPGRADGRRRRGAAPRPVVVRPDAARRRDDDRADDALSGRGRSPGRPGGGHRQRDAGRARHAGRADPPAGAPAGAVQAVGAVSRRRSRLPEALRRRGATLDATGQTVVCPVDSAPVGELLALAGALSPGVADVEIVQPTLEDVFLQLTKRPDAAAFIRKTT